VCVCGVTENWLPGSITKLPRRHGRSDADNQHDPQGRLLTYLSCLSMPTHSGDCGHRFSELCGEPGALQCFDTVRRMSGRASGL